MPHVLLISGSPTAPSKSAALLAHAGRQLSAQGIETTSTSVRDFPAEDLVQARYDSAAFNDIKAKIAEAAGVVIATPIYKAAYTGSLKALLDILPQQSLRGKTILPIATGGTLAHLLAVDYALKPVLGVLGASDIQQGVYVVDSQYQAAEDGGFILENELQQRFDDSLQRLAITVKAFAAS